MAITDTSEKGLEALIVAHLTGEAAAAGDSSTSVGRSNILETLDPSHAYLTGGYVEGDPHDYDRLHVLDWAKLLDFLKATQPKVVESFALENEGPSREQFLARLQGQIASRGIVDLLRKGFKHQWAQVSLFYGTPTPGNIDAQFKYTQNIFSVTRQVRYSPDEMVLSLDLVIFINGLPVATFELKNNLTKQTVLDAVRQYREDRSPQEPSSSWDAVLLISPSTSTRSSSAPTWPARGPGSFPSTRGSSRARATRPILTASRPPTSGRRSWSGRA